MGKRYRLSRRRKRFLIVFTAAAALAVSLLYFFRSPIIRYLYRNRYFVSAFDRTGSDTGNQPQILNFDFSLRDLEYFNSFAEGKSLEAGKRQTVDLNLAGENYTVDLLPFKSYFKKLKLKKGKNAFCVHFPADSQLKNEAHQFDLFRVKEADFYQQELVYSLGRRLGLFIPDTDYVNIYINFVDYGDYTLKQSLDSQFLEQNNVPDAIIFMVEKGQDGRYFVQYLYNEARNPYIEEHLERFPALLQARDPNLLIKYFDIDYIARFDALRKLLQASPGFVLHDNLRYIYNKVNGRIYPILDESNIANMLSTKKIKSFRFLHKQVSANPSIKNKRRQYLYNLGADYGSVIEDYKTLTRKYRGMSGDLFYQLRLKLVSAYFSTHIHRRLRKYDPAKRQAAAEEELPRENKTPAVRAARTVEAGRSKAYLDHLLMSPHLFVEKHKDLALRFDEPTGTIVLGPGNYTLHKTMIVPLGYRFEIRAGTTLRLAPQVSLVSYSPLSILGTAQKKVVISALDPQKPFAVVAVFGSSSRTGFDDGSTTGKGDPAFKKESRILHLDFSGGSQAFIDGVKHSGGLNIYDIDVEIKNSSIHHNRADSGLVIKNGTVRLENNSFYASHSDQLTLDFCSGVVKNNRFYDGGDDPGSDGVSVKGSRVLFHGNRFENLPDKGVSASRHSQVIFYANRFEGNHTAVAARDMGEALLVDNVLAENHIAAAAYRKQARLGGGSIYLAGNTLQTNKHIFKIDKYSKCFQLQHHKEPGSLFLALIKDERTDELFRSFARIKDNYRYRENRVGEFVVGKTPAFIDEANKVIVVNLPHGASVLQPIYFDSSLEKTRVFLIPRAYGIHRTTETGDTPKELFNLREYDFKEFIFRGQLNVQHDFQVDTYELVVTSGGLPIVEIDTADRSGEVKKIKNEPKIPCKVRFLRESGPERPVDDGYLNRFLEARVEGRGKKWEKWKYGITFERGIAPEGMRKSKRWVLESSYIEKSLMRTKLAFDLYDRFRDPSWKRIAPHSRFVEVILNGDYRGVYLLMEHIDRDFLELEDFDKNETFNALLYRAKNKNANFSRYNNPAALYKKGYEDMPGAIQPLDKMRDPLRGWSSGFEQRHPNPDKYGEHWGPLKEFSRFVALAPDEEFERTIFDRLDIDRYINLWIFTQFVDDFDGIYQNRYLVREKGRDKKWYFVPWDKDGVLGRDFKMDQRSWGTWLRTRLFSRCMNIYWFREAFKSTWDTLLANGVISEQAIFKMIDQHVALLQDAQQRNFRRWSTDPQNSPYPDDYTFYREIDYMKDWIHNRIQFLYNWILRIHNPENR
jgi:spore coat protein CotH